MSKLKLSLILLLFSFSLCSYLLIKSRSAIKGSPTLTMPHYVAAVLPHHLLAESFIDDFISRLDYLPQKIYIIGPNHPEIGQAAVVTNDNQESTNLQKLGFVRINNQIVIAEHSVGVIQDKFNNKFPQVSIIPLVVSANLTVDQIEQLSRYLSSNITDNTLIICSTDFSHYLLLPEAQQHDQDTLALITTKNYSKIFTLNNDNIDSAKSLLVFLKTLDLTGHNRFQTLNHSNSAILLNNPSIPSTTSYFELAFY